MRRRLEFHTLQFALVQGNLLVLGPFEKILNVRNLLSDNLPTSKTPDICTTKKDIRKISLQACVFFATFAYLQQKRVKKGNYINLHEIT